MVMEAVYLKVRRLDEKAAKEAQRQQAMKNRKKELAERTRRASSNTR